MMTQLHWYENHGAAGNHLALIIADEGDANYEQMR